MRAVTYGGFFGKARIYEPCCIDRLRLEKYLHTYLCLLCGSRNHNRIWSL